MLGSKYFYQGVMGVVIGPLVLLMVEVDLLQHPNFGNDEISITLFIMVWFIGFLELGLMHLRGEIHGAPSLSSRLRMYAPTPALASYAQFKNIISIVSYIIALIITISAALFILYVQLVNSRFLPLGQVGFGFFFLNGLLVTYLFLRPFGKRFMAQRNTIILFPIVACVMTILFFLGGAPLWVLVLFPAVGIGTYLIYHFSKYTYSIQTNMLFIDFSLFFFPFRKYALDLTAINSIDRLVFKRQAELSEYLEHDPLWRYSLAMGQIQYATRGRWRDRMQKSAPFFVDSTGNDVLLLKGENLYYVIAPPNTEEFLAKLNAAKTIQ